MKPARSRREKLGAFCVDSGCVLLGDPCQFIRDGGGYHLTYSQVGELFYEQGRVIARPAIVVDGVEVLPASGCRERATHVVLPGRSGGVAGIVATVGCDGWYPVFLESGEDGGPPRLVVELGGNVDP